MSLLPKTVLALVATLSLLVSPGHALIVSRYDGPGSPGLINTEPPADDPGWANLASNRSGIYLGDGWFLSARHAGATGGGVIMDGHTFPLIPGTLNRLDNPSSFGGSIDDESDILLWRVGVEAASGLTPEELIPGIRTIQIADSTPATSKELTLIGRGRERFLNSGNPETGEFYFTSSGANTGPANADFTGFRQQGRNPETNQWGNNNRTTSRPNGIRAVGSNIMIPATGNVSETIGYLTRFDENGLLNEATAAPGDSGGPVFFKEGDDWVLSGLMHVVFFPNGADFPSTGPFGAYGSYTGISDLSYSTYFNQLELLRSQQEYSIVGDLDLDGDVDGAIVNGQATGDLRLLVDNWMTSTSGDDIHSWMSGDINYDGVVDLEDFVLMREALGGSVSIQGFAALVGVAAVPEPATIALLLMGAAGAAARRVR